MNLAGHAAPLAAALYAVPALVSALGLERFGFIALAWAFVGYFSLFDLGIARALCRLVAELRGTGREEDLRSLTGGALTVTLGLGLAAATIIFASAAWICAEMLNLPASMVREATLGLQILAASVPCVTLTAALRGMLEGARHFGVVNAIRVPFGVLGFIAPLAVASQESPLPAVCAVLAGLRFAAVAAHWVACWVLLRPLALPRLPQSDAVSRILGYGAWVTVSNIVGPLMVYADRFVIGALISVAAVGYYSAPYEVLTRLWIVPAALTAALFPAMAAASPSETRILQRKGVLALLATVVPIAMIAALGSRLWIGAWLGADFATQATPVAQWLAVGIAVNCLGHIPFTFLQARGRADLTGMLHLAELPFYFAMLWMLTTSRGIEGAAMAWSARCVADSLMLFFLSARHMNKERRERSDGSL
ncbi:MAG TPA: flippase [Burkholderiales bacterium]|nr:flippase [Burkholderiales bacterium]